MIQSARVDEVGVWEAYIPFLRDLCALVDNISFGEAAVIRRRVILDGSSVIGSNE